VYLLNQDPILASQPQFLAEEGAHLQFLGTVRATEDQRPISGIDYSAYLPMAEHQLNQILAEARATQPPHRVFIQHRLGFVPVEHPSLLIHVFTKHSAAAFSICQHYLHAIKTSVPIWKKPIFTT
jgi:molybdopterin synthase catalytic subunit